MDFGICEYSLLPVRKIADNRSEMVTQLLFGETFTVIDKVPGWSQIRIFSDAYEGWIENKQFPIISEQEFKRLNTCPYNISTDLVQIIHNKSKDIIFPILAGSRIYGTPDAPYFMNSKEYVFSGSLQPSDQPLDKNTIIENAFIYQHSPYLWGGKSPFGIDCSGFVQMAFCLSGVQLLRDASQQATQGETINMISEALPTDLCFFDNDEGNIIHVGILLPGSKIIHASGQVRIDPIDHQGIFNTSTQSYSHKLRLIKRIL